MTRFIFPYRSKCFIIFTDFVIFCSILYVLAIMGVFKIRWSIDGFFSITVLLLFMWAIDIIWVAVGEKA